MTLVDATSHPRSEPAQEVLWTTVYNHDFPPRKVDKDQPYWARRWGGETGWSNLDKRHIRFDSRRRDNDFILLKGKPIVATNAYNVRDGFRPPPVGDMRVRLVWTPADEAAAMMIRLSKYGKTFWASFRADGPTLSRLSMKSELRAVPAFSHQGRRGCRPSPTKLPTWPVPLSL